MFDKRAQILFEAEEFKLLEALAAEREQSVGELVRRAVKRVYIQPKKQALSVKAKVGEEIKKLQLKTKQRGRVDYRALIDYGRKY